MIDSDKLDKYLLEKLKEKKETCLIDQFDNGAFWGYKDIQQFINKEIKMTDLFRKEYNSIHKLHSLEKEMKEQAERLNAYYEKCPGREMSLAMTNLEQSIMWATKAIYSQKDQND